MCPGQACVFKLISDFLAHCALILGWKCLMCTWRRLSALVFSEINLFSATKALKIKPMYTIGEIASKPFCAEMLKAAAGRGSSAWPRAAQSAATVRMRAVGYQRGAKGMQRGPCIQPCGWPRGEAEVSSWKPHSPGKLCPSGCNAGVQKQTRDRGW